VPVVRRAAGILAMCTAAVLCGCSSLEDVTAWVSAAGQEVLAALGCRRNALGVLTLPHPDTVVRVFTGIGAQQLADHAGTYLARRALLAPAVFPVAGPDWLPAISVDGKAVRGAVGADGLVPYLLAAATHGSCAVIAERLTGPKTNEVPEFAPLLRDLNRLRPPGRARHHHRRRPHRPRPRHLHLRRSDGALRDDREVQHPQALRRPRRTGLGKGPGQPYGHRDRARVPGTAHHPGDGPARPRRCPSLPAAWSRPATANPRTTAIAAKPSQAARFSSRCVRSGVRSPTYRAIVHPFRFGRSLITAPTYLAA